jgi:putative membrane protein
MPSDADAARSLDDGRRLHPLTLVFSAVGIARGMVWPALAGGFGFGDGDLARAVPIAVAVLAVPALIGAAAKYALYRWRVDADELLLRSGVLNRQNRVIPLARVQNVEVRQSLMQRVFGVAELRVETAGTGQQAEAVLSVLGVAEAQAARTELLARRRAQAPAVAEAEDVERPAAPPLARLSTGDLLVAGATANEAGVIAAAAAGLLQFADELPGAFFERAIEGVVERVQGAAVLAAVAGVVLLLLVGWMISIAGAVVRFHGFTLAVDGGEMRKRYGLLTVHEASVPLRRVQAIRVEETFLRRWLGLASLMIETAGGSPGERGGAEAFVPIARTKDVDRLVRGIFGDAHVDGAGYQRVHPKAERRIRRRYLFNFLLFVWAPFWVARWFGVQPGGTLAPYVAILLPLPFLAARWQYLNREWALPPGYVLARSGVLNRVTWIVPDRKLQTLHVRDTPFQRRLGLSTLVIDTAAGGRQASVIDLPASTARRVLEELAVRARAATLSSRAPKAEPASELPSAEPEASETGDADASPSVDAAFQAFAAAVEPYLARVRSAVEQNPAFTLVKRGEINRSAHALSLGIQCERTEGAFPELRLSFRCWLMLPGPGSEGILNANVDWHRPAVGGRGERTIYEALAEEVWYTGSPPIEALETQLSRLEEAMLLALKRGRPVEWTWKVYLVESEADWDGRIDEEVEFTTREDAERCVREYNERYNSGPVRSGWSMVARLERDDGYGVLG